MTTPLPRSRPEAQGVESGAIRRFLQALQERQLELHSFMLVRHDHVVAEGWWAPYGPERPHMLFSLTKSFTSTAIGLLVHEGELSLDDKVLSFFPDDAPQDVSPHLAAMAVRHLLTMSAGHDRDTDRRMQSPSDNWVRNFLQLPVEHEPGTHFVYNSGASYMLSAIIHKVSGLGLLDYLRPRLLQPLGIEGATTEVCPRGIPIGGWGMKITTEDIARFGQLYLHKGMWNGASLLPEAWVEEATSKQIDNGDNGNSDWAQGYGYQFWRCRHNAYRGDGAFGQYCIVLPEQDAVLAITSGVGDLQAVLDCVWEHLLPAMHPAALPEEAAGASALQRALGAMQLEPPRLASASQREAELSGAEYALEDNERGLRAFSVRFSDRGADVRLVIAGAGGDGDGDAEAHTLHFGRNEWATGTSRAFMRLNNPYCAAMTWRDDSTLVLTLRYVETPFCMTVDCTFGGEEVRLVMAMNVRGSDEPKPILGRARS